MQKKAIFLDGDGTLWYPKATKHTVRPHALYNDPKIKNHLEHLVLIPGTQKTLTALKKKGVLTFVLSAHPHEKDVANALLAKKVSHFGITDLFTEIHATRGDDHLSKGKYIVSLLKKYKIPKTRALMVGDSYRWDYLSARKVGVDARLMKTAYMKKGRSTRTIAHLSDILDMV